MTGMTDVDPEATEITNVVIGNLGGTGTYMDVIGMDPGADMHCPSTEAACVQEVPANTPIGLLCCAVF